MEHSRKLNKRNKAMKKSITIPSVDTDLYEAVKERCRQDGTSISAYFNSLLAGQAPAADESEKIKELTAQIVQLKTTLSKTERKLEEANNSIAELQRDSDNADNVCKEYEEENIKLTLNLTAKNAELEEAKNALETMKTQIESLRASSTNSVTVPLSPLEYALINHVTAKESKKHKKDITPALLLKTMFSEYCIHGETWFFDFPKRSEIKALQKQIEESNDTQEETNDENE